MYKGLLDIRRFQTSVEEQQQQLEETATALWFCGRIA